MYITQITHAYKITLGITTKSIHLLMWAALTLCSGAVGVAQTWTLTSAPSNNWVCVACSADGNKLAAVAYRDGLYTSTNAGLTWTETSAPTNDYWTSIAVSSDGTRLVAAADGIYTSGIYLSTNSGNTWTQSNVPSNEWMSVASSADGSRLVVVAPGDIHFNPPSVVYTSTDFGATWAHQTNAPGTPWDSVASSADGCKLMLFTADTICTSTNSGGTWMRTSNPPEDWAGSSPSKEISCSADGGKLAVILNGGFYSPSSIYVSTNFGFTWTKTSAPTNDYWTSIASSADGSKLIASTTGSPSDICGPIYISSDFGITWTSNNVSASWSSVAMSADGSKSVAVARPGGIYTLQTIPSPSLNLAPGKDNLALSWIVPSTNFLLQQSSDLAASNWSVVTNLPVFNFTNLQNQVILPLSDGKVFYRLKTP
jgi:BNR-Asp box repeat